MTLIFSSLSFCRKSYRWLVYSESSFKLNLFRMEYLRLLSLN